MEDVLGATMGGFGRDRGMKLFPGSNNRAELLGGVSDNFMPYSAAGTLQQGLLQQGLLPSHSGLGSMGNVGLQQASSSHLLAASASLPTLYHFTEGNKPAQQWYVAKRKPKLQKLEPVFGQAPVGKKRSANKKAPEQPLTKELLDAMEKMSPVNQRGKEIKKLLSAHGGPFTAKAEGIKKVDQEWKSVRQCTPIQDKRTRN
jgi:hypothetical protein